MQGARRQKSTSDGIGWLADYVTTLVHWYPSFTREFVSDELPMEEGWIWYSAAVLGDPMNKFGGIKPSGGFVKQEADKLIEIAHKSWQHRD